MTGDVNGDQQAWVAAVTALARAAPPTLPAVSWNLDVNGTALVASPALATDGFFWRLSGKTSLTSSLVFAPKVPKFDTYYPLQGFVRRASGTARNQLVIDTTVRVPGWCSAGPTLSCY